MTWTIILLILSIFLSAFFSGAEVALVSITEVKARHFYEKKIKHSKALLTLKKHPSKMLITILIGNNVVNIGGSALATKLAIDIFASAGVGIATGVMTFIILTFGEITPKTYASKNAKKVALFIAPLILFLMHALKPLVWLFYKISKGMQHINKNHKEPLVTEQEVRHMVKIGEEEGQIKPDEKEMIQRIFRFDDTEVHDIMTPRTDMYALEWNQTIVDVLPQITQEEFSRIPVYDKRLDKIKGIVLVRDLLPLIHNGGKVKKLKSVIRPALFVPEHKKIDKLLKELQQKKTHIAIVVNEHGGVEGLITIEDILEEIVGDIFDESDEVEHLIRPRGRNQWLVLGKTQIDVLNQELDVQLPIGEEYTTVAGLIQGQLARVPKEGEICELEDEKLVLTVKKMEGPTILEILLKKG